MSHIQHLQDKKARLYRERQQIVSDIEDCRNRGHDLGPLYTALNRCDDAIGTVDAEIERVSRHHFPRKVLYDSYSNLNSAVVGRKNRADLRITRHETKGAPDPQPSGPGSPTGADGGVGHPSSFR